MNLQLLADALRCDLSGKLMTDPAIVVFSDSVEIEVGNSYERAALEQWKQDRAESQLRFVSNPSLKAMTVMYGRLTLVPAVQNLMLK